MGVGMSGHTGGAVTGSEDGSVTGTVGVELRRFTSLTACGSGFWWLEDLLTGFHMDEAEVTTEGAAALLAEGADENDDDDGGCGAAFCSSSRSEPYGEERDGEGATGFGGDEKSNEDARVETHAFSF